MVQFISKIIFNICRSKFFNKFNITVSLFFVLLVTIITYASNPYSVEIENIDVGTFPVVQMDLSMTDNSGLNSAFFGKNFSVFESGKQVNGPIIVLPPGSYNNKIDLFILLDKSGATDNYEDIIKSNIKSLVKYMLDKGVDLNVKISSYDSSDNSYNFQSKELSTNYVNFDNEIDSLVFDKTRLEKVYGLEKIYSLVAQNYRDDAEKIALIINGSQYYDKNKDDTTVFSVADAIKRLVEKDFMTFVVGYPIKQMVAHRTNNTEDGSLAHSLPGGYYGSFSSDLTGIYDLLSGRVSNKYILRYFSNLSPKDATFVAGELQIDDYSVAHFDYSLTNNTQARIEHTPRVVLSGEPYNLEIRVYNESKLINVVEMAYPSSDGNIKTIVMEHKKNSDSDDYLVYDAVINSDDIVSDNFIYYFILHTPYRMINFYSDIYVTPVFEYESGITLVPQLINDKEVLWRWSGETVDKGKKYQLYMGDKMITETADRFYTIPLGDCDLYQIVKVRVLLKDGVDHPRAGEWSLFSLPFEYYAGPDGTVSEKRGIEEMFKCLNNKEDISFNDFVSSEDDYSAESKLSMNKMLEYITGVSDDSLRSRMKRSRYSMLYYFMHFIDSKEIRTYKKVYDKIPYSILYKVITNINQSDDFVLAYNKAKDDVAEWILGDFSF